MCFSQRSLWAITIVEKSIKNLPIRPVLVQISNRSGLVWSSCLNQANPARVKPGAHIFVGGIFSGVVYIGVAQVVCDISSEKVNWAPSLHISGWATYL